MKRILVLGASGMIGSAMLRVLAKDANLDVIGSIRATVQPMSLLTKTAKMVLGVDLANVDQLARLFREVQPDVVINCAGLTKHVLTGNDPLPALLMNALLPHRLGELCSISQARLIHISTDCVFSGEKGNYCEGDKTDAADVYGKTKQLGEVTGPRLVTLRTSTIGHEMGTQYGLLEWFLVQERCKGYRKAFFSGLPTVEFARVIRDFVIPDLSLEGLYHVGAEVINKDALLRLIARIYRRAIDIEPDDEVVIDRSLDSTRFFAATGYRAPSWTELIEVMHQDKVERN
jgi:dTDP-4-dehydrorhamnose reductase